MVAGIKAFTIALGAALAVAGVAGAQPVNMVEAKALGRNIAASAARAERAAGIDGVQQSVRVAVQGVIIGAGSDPMVVLAALDQVTLACKDGRIETGWTCPGSADAYRAIASIRGIVIAQITQADPAALDTPGSAPLGSVPSTSAGGSNYRSL